jgi:membrane protein YdbS with pleckstrin-like domain
MFCPKCGSGIDEGSNFCKVCGAKVSGEDANLAPAVNITGQGTPAAPDQSNAPESDLWEGGRSGKKFIFQYLLAGVLLAGALTAVVIWPEGLFEGSKTVSDNEKVKQAVRYVRYIPLALAGLFTLIVWVRMMLFVHSLKYRLTSERLFITAGLLSKHMDELDLFRVNDVTLSQSFLDRMFGIGTVTVISNDETTPVIEMKGIPDSFTVKEHIRNAASKRRKSGLLVEHM